MKIKVSSKSVSNAGFTLVEMIGVLAIVAILASLLVPKVFNAINRAKINSTAMVLNTVKAAVTEAYGERGQFTLVDGSILDASAAPFASGILDYDANVLVPGDYMTQEFTCKVGVEDGTDVHAVLLAAGGTATSFDLDGDGVTTDVDADQWVVWASIPNVSARDARELSLTVDGPDLTAALNVNDTEGRVLYDTTTEVVQVYITSR